MSKGLEYLREVMSHLRGLEAPQRQASIRQAAGMIADAVVAGGTWYVTGSGHASIVAQEVFMRAGAFMLAHAIFVPGLGLDQRKPGLVTRLERLAGIGQAVIEEYKVGRGDVLTVFSPPGRNAVQVELAMAAREAGAKVIAIQSSAWSSTVTSRHPSGKLLGECADLVIDDGTPPGDAVLDIPGVPARVLPISSILGVAIINMLQAELLDALVKRGWEPPVYVSANVDGGDVKNAELMAKFKDRIRYL